jgi:D-3-phosphoglycerate dehydrogenase / 2-oxoglutarate reductase
MKKILITDAVDKKSIDILRKAGYDVTFQTGMKQDEIKKIIEDYHGLIVRSDTQVDADLISSMKKMEIIGRAGTGVDNIDVDAATRKGIIVMNTPGGNTISTAEHTMSLLLSMCRNIPRANQSLREGKWERKSFKGTELHGKTLGIIGLGKIGREVALRAKSFGMTVIGYDTVLSDEIANKIDIRLLPLIEVIKKADFISVHVPLTKETENIISYKEIEQCKTGVRLINCARGGILDEEAILHGLQTGKIAAAAFDVFVNEPPDKNSELINHPNVICTPHLGASTGEAQEKVAIQIAEQMVDYFKGNTLKGTVNATAIESFAGKEISAYVKLADQIGSLHAQMVSGSLKQININFSGELLSAHTQILTAALLKGFLSHRMQDPVNYVNAQFLSKEMGIIINETISGSKTNYNSLLAVDVITDHKNKFLAGTVFGENEIRIVYINAFHLELKPDGNMLFYTNIDKPGVLANVSKVLANAGINIAGLSLGRTGIGKEALTVVNVDSKISNEIINEIEAIDGIQNVFAVIL